MSLDSADYLSTRKPVVALMGEFSAGKSTLANLLMGNDYLPVQVIATRLPPVWISHGDAPAFRLDLDGGEHPVDLERLSDVPLDDTLYIRIFSDEDILKQCDLIDMPGISDPNMSSEVWQRVMPHADSVLWCTHATQAWRQSEAAVWASMPSHLYDRSLLLLTRIDKLTNDRDRERVIRRVQRETEGKFVECLPISLLQATQVQDDYDIWSQSGAETFARKLVDLLHRVSCDLEANDSAAPLGERRPVPAAFAPRAPLQVVPDSPRSDAETDDATAEIRIMPRRVAAPARGRSSPRPEGRVADPLHRQLT